MCSANPVDGRFSVAVAGLIVADVAGGRPMTEAEWEGRDSIWTISPTSELRDDHRKLYLFLAALLPRLLLGRMCPICRDALRLFEETAERRAVVDDWIAAVSAHHTGARANPDCPTRRVFLSTVQYLRGVFCPAEYWHLLLDASGAFQGCDPQRPLASAVTPQMLTLVERDDLRELGREAMRYFADVQGNPRRPASVDPSWLTSNVVALAQGIYAELAFDRLPILADALQDAGCEHPDILTHLRGDGPHVRGCWALDLVLGKG
jgi:hypothetical protein